MADFHVLHWIPDPRLHIFNGYNEVIETVIWGLRALGHDVTYAVNQLRGGAVPIVFGAQQLLAQHRGLWQLLEARASARQSG